MLLVQHSIIKKDRKLIKLAGEESTMNEIFDTYCGLCCETCNHKEEFHCGGCIATEGNPFHGNCQVAECAKSKHIRFCGECEGFPCDLLISFSNDEEHGDMPKGSRIERCKDIKETLAASARVGINPISCCGLHCDFCFFGKWCGGCRSDYNCCSFASIFENHECPNLVCAESRDIDSCYKCKDLVQCKTGYFSIQDEYIAKASAIFIQKYGEECYSIALNKAIQDGISYPNTFDESGSVIEAMKLLERYL